MMPPVGVNKRLIFFLFTLTASITFFFESALLGRERIFVYLPLPIRPRVIEKQLLQTLPTVEIKVFGYAKDFRAAILASSPEGIIAPPLIAGQFPEYLPQLRGIRGSAADEPLVLLLSNTRVQNLDLRDATLGIIDYLFTEEIKARIKDQLGGLPRLRLVPKMEDLLPLMLFGMADGILVQNSNVAYFKAMSRISFTEIPLPKLRLGIVTLAVRGSEKKDNLIQTIRDIPSKVNQTLGIESWEK